MAATRLMALHQIRGRTIAESLKERMDYTENDLKTEEKKYISTYGCDIETADEEFLLSQLQKVGKVVPSYRCQASRLRLLMKKGLR